MVKIRLMRVGTTGKPAYRVVAADSRSPRDGRFIEIIGQYDPKPHPSLIEIDEAKALAWLAKGAKPTDSTLALLKRAGVWQKHTEGKPRTKPSTRTRPRKAAAKS